MPDLPSNHNISLLQPSDIDKFVQFVPERDHPFTVIGHFHKTPSTFFTQQEKICNKTCEVYETHILPRWFHSFKNSDQLKKEANRFFCFNQFILFKFDNLSQRIIDRYERNNGQMHHYVSLLFVDDTLVRVSDAFVHASFPSVDLIWCWAETFK